MPAASVPSGSCVPGLTTLASSGVWLLRLVPFSNGDGEATFSLSPVGCSSGGGSYRSKLQRGLRVRLDSDRRATRQVRWIARQCGLRMMVTLTYPGEGVHDRALAFSMMTQFLKLYGLRYVHFGRGYVGVLELHPLGHGYHSHIVVGGSWWTKGQISRLRVRWTQFCKSHGLHPSGDSKWCRIHVKRWASHRKAAWYIAKYVRKDGQDASSFGKRRYTTHLGAKVAEERRRFATLAELLASIPGRVVLMWRSAPILSDGTVWLGPPSGWLAYERLRFR